MSKALIVVDFQTEWTKKDSEYFIGDISQLIQRTNTLIQLCREQGYRIIFTLHHEENSEGIFDNDEEVIVDRKEEDILIVKKRISPFYNTDLDKKLEDIDEITVCGLLTNLCVRSLVQDAYDRDFDIRIVRDCCAAMDNGTHEFTLKDLKATRPEIQLLTLQTSLTILDRIQIRIIYKGITIISRIWIGYYLPWNFAPSKTSLSSIISLLSW